jgi:ABC-type Fe3+-siderophore transport system permease subunit
MKYWFKAKEYGWGWYPVTWQGWLVLGAWFVLFVALMSRPDEGNAPWPVLVGVIASVIALIAICWKTGERPSWRWGGKPAHPARVLLYATAIAAFAAAISAIIVFIISSLAR